MADDPLEEIEDDGTTDEIESAFADTSLQPEDSSASEPVKAVPAFNKRSAGGTIKVGS
jgi:hypothetical protein